MTDDLDTLRATIDELDAELVALLARRFDVSRRVGAFKRRTGATPRDAAREARQLLRLRDLAGQEGVSPDLAEAILRLIVDRVVAEHQEA